MKAYKYKPLSNIEHVLDIVLRGRLYCANWRELNDPMEGKTSIDIAGNIGRINTLFDEQNSCRVCALSKKPDSVLSWGYYADGFRGVVIEVDLPDDNLKIKPVTYVDPYQTPINFKNTNKTDGELAMDTLHTKFKIWEHEGEIRVIQKDDYYFDVSVTKVILGWKAIEQMETKSHILHEVCRYKEIEIAKARPVGVPPNGLKVKITALDESGDPLLGGV